MKDAADTSDTIESSSGRTGIRGGRGRPSGRWLKASLRRPVESQSSPDSGESRQASVVSLDALIADPGRASEVPRQQIPTVLARLAAEQAALSALQGALTARLVSSQSEPRPDPVDRLLTADEVAGMLGMTKRWVQRRARRFPFARKLSDRAVRYSEAGLKRWMVNRRINVA